MNRSEPTMTELIYQRDSYVKGFQAVVKKVLPDEIAVVLERSAFYPGGGGQPADAGVLSWTDNISKVSKVKMRDGQVLHFLDPEQPLPVTGETISGQIDWERRYQLMRTHTAMHILCGVVWRDFGAQVTGGNMAPMKGRMDFEFASLKKELVKDIEAGINREVARAREVSTRILPRNEAFKIPDLIRTKINLLPEAIKEVRVVEIEGLDLQADGGTHVKNTSEVGTLKIAAYKSKGAINKRIYLELS